MFLDSRAWRHVAGEFSASLHVSHFQSFICLWVLILWRSRSRAFEDEITKPGAAKASFRIPFLYVPFHVPVCPPRATTGCWGNEGRIFLNLFIFFPAWLVIYERSSVFCLNAKLLGKDYRFASPDATVSYWQAARSFSRKKPSLKHSMSADLPLMSFPSIWFVRKERLCVHATVQSYLCV